MTLWDTLVPATPHVAARHRAEGWWRDTTFLDDLARNAAGRGDHPAVIASAGALKTLSYRELAAKVERFGAALRQLGVERGDVVVAYLPNIWQLTALYLACHRIGAVSSPVIPALGARELAHVLTASRAKVCVTIDAFGGIDYAGRLAQVAPPSLAHQVVLGNSGYAVDFAEFFERTPWEERAPVPVSDRLGPDEPAQLLFTSGTTGTMKAVAHSQNTIYAALEAVAGPYRLTAADVITIPSFLTHMAAMCYAAYLPLTLGATSVLQDRNADPDLLLDLMAAHRVTWAYCSPAHLVNLLATQRKQPRDLAGLQRIVSGSAPIQPQLVAEVREVLDVPLHALWGMTENGAVTVTRPDDPEGWAAHSDGRSMPSMQVRIDERSGHLLVRGASQCLGYLGQPDVYAACVDDEGWFDTGDLARDDGRGGIRITGRRADLITRASGQKVSTLEVESVLLRHPAVIEAVLVGYPDPAVPGTDLVCAVVVPDGTPIGLPQLHAHLAAEGMAQVLWPDRVQFMAALPKNSLGKVLRAPLRERLELAGAGRP